MPFIPTEMRVGDVAVFRLRRGLWISEPVKFPSDESDRAWINRLDAEVRREALRHEGSLRCLSCNYPSQIDEEQSVILCSACCKWIDQAGHDARSYEEDDLTVETPQDESFVEKARLKEYYKALLDEPLLVRMMAHKCRGFTERGSEAYYKAQRYTATLVGHFVYGYGFAELALRIPGKNGTHQKEKAVELFCKRASEGFTEYLLLPWSEEATKAINLGWFRRIYPEHEGAAVRAYS